MATKKFPGCIYQNGSRYWWKVKLPGDTRARAMPLVPVGGSIATNDPAVAEAIAANLWKRALQAAPSNPPTTVAELVQVYYQRLRERFGQDDKEVTRIGYALDAVAASHGSELAEKFGPLKLQEVRKQMILAGLTRKVVNIRIRQIVRMFKFGVSREIVPASVLVSLQAVEAIRKGEGVEIEGVVKYPAERPKIKPVADAWVDATLKYARQVLKDMVLLQRLTGMRSGELVRIRPMDLDMSDREIWWYKPAPVHSRGPAHKTEHHGVERMIPIGPQGREILARYVSNRPTDACCFSAAELRSQRYAELRAKAKTPRRPSQVYVSTRPPEKQRKPRPYFTSDTYAQAIEWAIRYANSERRKEAKGQEIQDIPHWHPHQLRHAAATRIRKLIGRDAAKATLGHQSLSIIDTYAEIDEQLARRVAKELG